MPPPTDPRQEILRITPVPPPCAGWGHGLSTVCRVCPVQKPCGDLVHQRGLDRRSVSSGWDDPDAPFGVVPGSVADAVVRTLTPKWVEVHIWQRKVKALVEDEDHATRLAGWVLRHLARRKELWAKQDRRTNARLIRASQEAP